MRAFTQNRTAHTPDEIWMVEHPAVYTQGQAGRAEHIIDLQNIPLVQSDRGGQITYHGPGQAIAYVLIDLKRKQCDLKDLLHALESSVIHLLAHYQIQGSRREGAPGVYVGDAKLAFVGLRIRKGCSYHGISFNIDMDLSPFSCIDPCGYHKLPITQLRDLGCLDAIDVIIDRWVGCLQQALAYNL